jgi:hypothetical protein
LRMRVFWISSWWFGLPVTGLANKTSPPAWIFYG